MLKTDKEFLIQVRADINKAVTNLERLTREVEKQGKTQQRTADQTQKSAFSLENLVKAAAAYITVASAIRKIKLADQFQQLDQRVKTATKSTGDYVRVSQDLYATAQRNGAAMADTVSTFQRLSLARRELQATNAEILKVTGAVQQLGALSGASHLAMRAGQLQFAQALGASVVRAEELNSIIENLPAVADRIARGMGMTTGELRAAVLEGRVLSREVFESLLSQTDEIAAEFAAVPVSLSRALTKLDNATGTMLASLERRLGLIQHTTFFIDQLTGAMDDAEDFSEFMAGMGAFGTDVMFQQQAIAQGRREWRAMQEEVSRYKEELKKVNAQIDEMSGQLLSMDPVNTTEVHDELGRKLQELRRRQRELNQTIEETEQNYRKAGQAGSDGAKLTMEEQKRLADQMAVVKDKLSEQLSLFDQQKKALADAERAAADFESKVTAAQSSLSNTGKDALGLGDITAQINKAKSALSQGDNQQAVQEAEKALAIIEKVGQSSDEVQGVLEYMLRQAAQVGREASQGLIEQEQAAFEQIKTSITDLLAEAQELKSLQVGFDKEAAKLEAEFIRATLQEEFNNNPLVLPVVLQKPDAGSDKRVEDAIESLPGKAAGGLLVGPGSGASDSILLRGSNGEYMVNATAVSHYGVPFMDRLNRKQLPRYADGGLIGRTSPSIPTTTGQTAGLSGRPVNLYLDGQRYTVSADTDTADKLERDFRLAMFREGGKR
jgi:tape measure domain-containing protein